MIALHRFALAEVRMSFLSDYQERPLVRSNDVVNVGDPLHPRLRQDLFYQPQCTSVMELALFLPPGLLLFPFHA